jgi:uncharacterized protein with PIN domain/sulfur carrier protein ThiS
LAIAIFRFYEELNEFLPTDQRKCDLELEFEAPTPVRHLIETLGIPHTEVEVILLNGVSVDLEQRVKEGDRVSVYPMFESLDITPLLRLRERPLRDPRFIVDAHLGRLSHYLRMLGFDTLFENDFGDRELARISAEDRRILLTGDRALLMHRAVTHGCYLRSHIPRQQLEYVVERLDLCSLMRPFSRCMECNGLLQAATNEEVVEQLPENIRLTQNDFRRCGDCGKVYWKGSHYQRMVQVIERLCPGFWVEPPPVLEP